MFYYLHTALIHCWDSDPRNYEPFTLLFSSASLLCKEEVDRTADGPANLSCWCWNWDKLCPQPIFGYSLRFTWHSCVKAQVLVTQSCPTLCNPMGYSLPASSLGGILQARIMEWVATLDPFSLLQMTNFHFLNSWVLFHCVCVCVYTSHTHTPHPLHPFTYRWSLCSLAHLGYCK